MCRIRRCLVLALALVISQVDGDTFSIRISTESHVNVVDRRFVSFTIDPKHLFTSGNDFNSKESTCMAASLTPAYLRIAGPSTSHITFNNRSLTIDHLDANLPEPNKQKRHLKKEEEIEDFDTYDSEESHEDILTKLRRSSDRLLNRHKRDLDSEGEELSKHRSEVKKEDNLLSKLKKGRIHALKKKKRNPELNDDNVKTKSLYNDSQENILSKLRKPKRQGKETKLSKFIKTNQEVTSEERPKRLRRLTKEKDHLEVSHKQWKRFAKWAKDTGFSLVFAVNNGQKTENGMWDPNPALDMLTIANKDDFQDIFWQLGYECNNQTLEDYLNDLQTLRMMVDSFGDQRWKVVGGDVSGCLQAGSKSDFKDYVTLSTDNMDAVLLNGNSTSHELALMPDDARLSLLSLLSTSGTPLWLTESPQQLSEQARAADWLTSLGYSARNGFNVHFRELLQRELYEPTLSFYMALLFKNLVGERVLDVTMEPSEGQAALFAHCTSLRHKAVPGAVTLYGVNMDSEPARFSAKLSKREEGGDIMQFILGHDHSGNIVVNGRPMFYEGNIRPVVKRVRPYKTLLLNLPPKSFGFWVLANTKVNACFDYDDKDNATLVEAKPVNETKIESEEENADLTSEEDGTVEAINKTKVKEDTKKKTEEADDDADENSRRKRSVNIDDFAFDIDLSDFNEIDKNDALINRIDSINRGLRDVQGLIGNKDNLMTNRVKRQVFEEEFENRRKPRRQLLKKSDRKLKHESLLGSGIFEKLMNNVNSIKIPKLNLTRTLKELKQRKAGTKSNISKLSKRNSRNYRNREDLNETEEVESLSRKKRSLLVKNKTHDDDETEENEIESDNKKHFKLGRFSKKHKKYLIENDNKQEDDEKSNSAQDGIEINTKITDDDAEIKISENADHGLIKSAFENVLSLLEELNHNLSKLWTALSLFD